MYWSLCIFLSQRYVGVVTVSSSFYKTSDCGVDASVFFVFTLFRVTDATNGSGVDGCACCVE